MKTRICFNLFLLLFALFSTLTSCKKTLPSAPKEDEILDGPIAGLSYEENQRFLKGDVAFNDRIFTSATGLGPSFVATSCGSCHAGDGKGHPSTTLTRFGQADANGNTYLHLGGPQLQNRAIPGYQPEIIPAGATFAKFTPPANTGLGYLEWVTDAYLLSLSDPDDANGDGISGRVNWISLAPFLNPHPNAISLNGKYIHRFGKKAAAYNLLNQTVNAYNQDMGIASLFSPVDVYSHLVTDPEISNEEINNVVFYLQTLKAPIQRASKEAEIVMGNSYFQAIGCESCHKQTLRTGDSPIPVLSNKEFHPYTDLLLHDMGPRLDDGYSEGSAETYEWRTAPLWGLGLSKNSQGGRFYLMHDGRASSIEEAIRMHGGEAESSKVLYEKLTEPQKEVLLKFLNSL